MHIAFIDGTDGEFDIALSGEQDSLNVGEVVSNAAEEIEPRLSR